MKESQNNSWCKARLKSFGYAFEGLWYVFKNEKNARFQLIIAVLVIILGLFLKVNTKEWLWLIVAIASVISSEVFNSAIEHLADVVCVEKDERFKRIKDMSAAAVLITAVFALAVGLIILLPKAYALF